MPSRRRVEPLPDKLVELNFWLCRHFHLVRLTLPTDQQFLSMGPCNISCSAFQIASSWRFSALYICQWQIKGEGWLGNRQGATDPRGAEAAGSLLEKEYLRNKINCMYINCTKNSQASWVPLICVNVLQILWVYEITNGGKMEIVARWIFKLWRVPSRAFACWPALALPKYSEIRIVPKLKLIHLF